MGIDKIDKNLDKVSFDDSDCVWFDAKEDVFSLSGICFDKNENRYCRISNFDAKKISENSVIRSENDVEDNFAFSNPFAAIYLNNMT